MGPAAFPTGGFFDSASFEYPTGMYQPHTNIDRPLRTFVLSIRASTNYQVALGVDACLINAADFFYTIHVAEYRAASSSGRSRE
jgi:hypothetical protein